MKFSVILFGLVMFSLLVMGGCGMQPLDQGQKADGGPESVDSIKQAEVDAEKVRVESLLSQQDKLKQYVEEGDVSKCSDFEADPFKVTCEATILAGKATGAEDVAVCEDASRDVVREKCEFLVGSM